MARPLREGEVRVLVRGGACWGRRSARYERRLAGMTVKAALVLLHPEEMCRQVHPLPYPGLPQCIMEPYYVNGAKVTADSDRVLVQGDVLSCDDP